MLDDLEKFFGVLSNLPVSERKLPVLVLNKQPISWNLAAEEISNETDAGKRILKMLKELKII